MEDGWKVPGLARPRVTRVSDLRHLDKLYHEIMVLEQVVHILVEYDVVDELEQDLSELSVPGLNTAFLIGYARTELLRLKREHRIAASARGKFPVAA